MEGRERGEKNLHLQKSFYLSMCGQAYSHDSKQNQGKVGRGFSKIQM